MASFRFENAASARRSPLEDLNDVNGDESAGLFTRSGNSLLCLVTAMLHSEGVGSVQPVLAELHAWKSADWAKGCVEDVAAGDAQWEAAFKINSMQ